MTDAKATNDSPTQPGRISTGRVQLALNVSDLSVAVRFYRALFGTEPNKERPGYANFAIADPPLKLVLFENPDAVSPLNHLGVELSSTDDVADAAKRFAGSDLQHTQSTVDRCCHAVQDKVWVNVPDVPLGAWEFYTILDDPEPGENAPAGACCTSDTEQAPCCGSGREA